MKIIFLFLLNFLSTSVIKMPGYNWIPESKKITVELKNDGGATVVHTTLPLGVTNQNYDDIAHVNPDLDAEPKPLK